MSRTYNATSFDMFVLMRECICFLSRFCFVKLVNRICTTCNTRTYIYLFNEYYLRYHTLSPTQNVSLCDKVAFTSSNGYHLSFLFFTHTHTHTHNAHCKFSRAQPSAWPLCAISSSSIPNIIVSFVLNAETYFIIGCLLSTHQYSAVAV